MGLLSRGSHVRFLPGASKGPSEIVSRAADPSTPRDVHQPFFRLMDLPLDEAALLAWAAAALAGHEHRPRGTRPPG